MKKIFLTLLAAIIVLAACDKIEGPYTVPVLWENATNGVEFDPIDPKDIKTNVYFEEFTGHTCVNCPAAQDELTRIKETYGDGLIVMAIHATSFARPLGTLFAADYMTETGNTLADEAGAVSAPSGWVNRKGELNTAYITWETLVNEVPVQDAKVAIQMVPEVDNVGKKLKINTRITPLQEFTEPVLYTIYLLEDSIISPQKDSRELSGYVENYVHNHMLRTSFPSTYGNRITESGLLKKDEQHTIGITIGIDNEWTIKNCSVVGVICNETTKEVIQAEIIHLGNGHK